MPRPKKLREPGDTQVRKAWNKKKTRKYTIAITSTRRGEAPQEDGNEEDHGQEDHEGQHEEDPAKKPRKASKATSKSKAKRSSR